MDMQNNPSTAPTLLKDSSKKKALWQEHRYLLLCLLIPAALMYLIYLAREIHPFGNGCVLVLDLNGQYVWFFEALRNFVKGDASMLYSFSRALGGEFLGIYAYYIASPLSYIVCLFPEDKTLEALLTIFLIKTALCGCTFGYYMHRTSSERKPFSIVIFSTFYALTSYAVVQQHNTMWIDAVMWLPLITLGIEELIKHGKYKMYTVFLALTPFSNFYIGYMLCIYCLLYFFLYYVAHNEEHRNNPLREKNHFFRSLFRIAFFSLVALGIAAVILLSAYYALNFGKTTFSNPSWEWTLKFDALDLLYKFLPGSYDTVRPAGLPFVYCGILTLLLLPAYFLSDKYPMRQKIVSGIFIFIFLASFAFSVTDLIWHGFQKPNWLNYRYSFMLCFYLCVLACRAFSAFDTVSLKSVMGTGGLIALLCVILQKYTDGGEYVKPDDYTCILFTLVMIFVYLAVLGLLKRTTNEQMIAIVLVAAVAIEVFLNGLWNMNALDDDVTYSKYSYYNDFLDKSRPITEMVQESDTSFYRMEKTFFRKTNDNMALNIRGLSGSTSTLNKETIQFLHKMGYASKSHWSKYLGGTPVNDSLLGLKYIISDSSVYKNYYEVYKTDLEYGYTAYYNPYALSIAYGVDDDLLKFPLGYVSGTIGSEEEDDEEEPSRIAATIAKLKSTLNEWFDIEETINNAEYVDEYDSPFERLNAMITAMLGESETVNVFVPIEITEKDTTNLTQSYVADHLRYAPTNPDQSGILSYSIEMPVSAELFFYMPSDYPREVKLDLEEAGNHFSKGTFHANETDRIISLGKQTEGDELKLNMTMTTTYLYPKLHQQCFYYIDWAVFEDAMARLAKDQYQITEYTETSFKGTFTASRQTELVMTTIPYDKGWKITVDGVEVEPIKALGSLVAFYIDGQPGQTHDVELVYQPNTFVIGLTVSLLSLALFIAIVIFEKRIRKMGTVGLLVAVKPGLRKKKAEAEVEAEVEVEESLAAPPIDSPTDAPNDDSMTDTELDRDEAVDEAAEPNDDLTTSVDATEKEPDTPESPN